MCSTDRSPGSRERLPSHQQQVSKPLLTLGRSCIVTNTAADNCSIPIRQRRCDRQLFPCGSVFSSVRSVFSSLHRCRQPRARRFPTRVVMPGRDQMTRSLATSTSCVAVEVNHSTSRSTLWPCSAPRISASRSSTVVAGRRGTLRLRDFGIERVSRNLTMA